MKPYLLADGSRSTDYIIGDTFEVVGKSVTAKINTTITYKENDGSPLPSFSLENGHKTFVKWEYLQPTKETRKRMINSPNRNNFIQALEKHYPVNLSDEQYDALEQFCFKLFDSGKVTINDLQAPGETTPFDIPDTFWLFEDHPRGFTTAFNTGEIVLYFTNKVYSSWVKLSDTNSKPHVESIYKRHLSIFGPGDAIWTKPESQTELTLLEIADKFGVDVSNLRIKDS